MDRLRAHVESIVGPLRASERRKDAIREELLQHLEAACERAAGGGAPDPEASAMERLGGVDALRADLQDAVPALEHRLYTPFRWMEPLGELFRRDPAREPTPLRYAARRTWFASVFVVVLLLSTLAGLATLDDLPLSRILARTYDLPLILGSFAASSLFSFWLLERSGVRAKLDERDPRAFHLRMPWLIAFTLAWGGSFVGAVEVVIPGTGPHMVEWLASWSPWGWGSVFAALAMVGWFAAWDDRIVKARRERWGTGRT